MQPDPSNWLPAFVDLPHRTHRLGLCPLVHQLALPADIAHCILDYFTTPEIRGCAGHVRAIHHAMVRYRRDRGIACNIESWNFWASTTTRWYPDFEDSEDDDAYDDDQIRSLAKFPSVFRFPGMVMGRHVVGVMIP